MKMLVSSKLSFSTPIVQPEYQLAMGKTWVLRSASWAARISGRELRKYSTQVLIFASRYWREG
ncbi:hypothetical protein D3C86_2158900 [compost metagenome]